MKSDTGPQDWWLKAGQCLVHPLPNVGLNPRRKEATDCPFCDVSECATCVSDNAAIWINRADLGIQRCKLRLGPLVLAGSRLNSLRCVAISATSFARSLCRSPMLAV